MEKTHSLQSLSAASIFNRSAWQFDFRKFQVVCCLMAFQCLAHAAAPTGSVSASSIQNFAVGENSRAEILINAYVGDDPSSFTPGSTTVDNVINTAEAGGCAQILINSVTAYPCVSGGSVGAE